MIKQSLALVGLTLLLSANADILSFDSSFGMDTITRDTATGLDWLDVTVTAGLSVNEVAAEMESGGEYEGWRYATMTEVDQLITNFGYVPLTPCSNPSFVNCTNGLSGDNPIIELMIQTLGDTYALDNPTFDYTGGGGDTLGYALNDVDNFGDYNIALISDYEFGGVDFNDDIVLNGDTSSMYGGSFLVSASPAPVDSDSDGVPDNADNCIDVANAGQRDTNGDGFGNACDPDFDNNGVVNFLDISAWISLFNTACGDVDEDINGDGGCNFGDFATITQYFNLSPGPSGVAP